MTSEKLQTWKWCVFRALEHIVCGTDGAVLKGTCVNVSTHEPPSFRKGPHRYIHSQTRAHYNRPDFMPLMKQKNLSRLLVWTTSALSLCAPAAEEAMRLLDGDGT